MTSSALAGYLIVSGLLLVIGVVGFLVRRNLIVMFLCTELMFQGAAIAFIAMGRYLFDYSGQVMVIFILTVAAAEAALALALVVLMHRQGDSLDADAFSELTE
ncbi:MAG: NADH-quinone oxidoreductase subunit NuoK [Phycisphaerae bacterium]|nr:NADH-quinone oxidoreductase subunit NuoK [Phycisphaerae bacterium]MBT6164354.1 NADH-quinone oxidoreductase subunit NuoK [Phycisphaerae bacterium]MBT7658374.1 NADH-quinone oxidoreductase subunit NuoK [Phycisphaerae bacterium]